VIETGTPEEVLDADLLEQVYGVRPTIVAHPVHGVPQILLQGSLEPAWKLKRTEDAG